MVNAGSGAAGCCRLISRGNRYWADDPAAGYAGGRRAIRRRRTLCSIITGRHAQWRGRAANGVIGSGHLGTDRPENDYSRG